MFEFDVNADFSGLEKLAKKAKELDGQEIPMKLTLPEEIIRKYHAKEPFTPEEQAIFDAELARAKAEAVEELRKQLGLG